MTLGVQIAAGWAGCLFAAEPPPPQPMPDLGWWPWIWFLSWLFSILCLPFWVWMLWHCYRHEPDREFWFWVMIFIPPAAMVYFFARWLPGGGGGTAMPKGLKRWTKGREIEQLQTAARQIGNPHHWIQLGDALRDVGRYAEATQAYEKALAKEADNIQALWGAGVANLEQGQFQIARDLLEKGLAIKPDYKFGDMSLAYARALAELGEVDQSARHLEGHICRWRHAEALYLLATLELERGKPEEARGYLEALLLDINGSPKAIARKQTRWKSRATKLLKQIPR